MLTLTILPIMVVGGTAYVQSRNLLVSQANEAVPVFLKGKVDQIDNWITIKNVRLDRFTRRVDFVSAANAVLSGNLSRTEFLQARETMLAELRLANVAATDAVFNEFIFVDRSGEILVASNPEWQGLNVGEINVSEHHNLFSETGSHARYAPEPLYPDSLVVMTSRPFRDRNGNASASVIGITERLAIQRFLNPPGTNQRIFLFTEDGQFIASDESGESFVLFSPTTEQKQIVENGLEFTAISTESFSPLDTDPAIAAYSWVADLNIGLIAELPESTVLEQINSASVFTAILLGLTILLFVILLVFSLTRVTRPLMKVVSASRAFAEGDWEARAQVERSDELGMLAFSFNRMAEDLSKLYKSLRQQVEERTRQVLTASEVAQSATSAQSLADLLETTTELIVDRFGYYHSAIFLVDQSEEDLLLEAATGDAGRHLKATNFQVPLKSESIVAWVARTNQPRISADTKQDPLYLDHELLPETRSEVGIPISIGNQVLGVVDVQSRDLFAFSEENVDLLQTIANQLASAVRNFQSLEGTAFSLQEVNALYQGSRQIAKAETIEQILEATNKAIQQTSYISSLYSAQPEQFALVTTPGEQVRYAARLQQHLNISPESAREFFSAGLPIFIKEVVQPTTPLQAELLTALQRVNCEAGAYLPIMDNGEVAAIMVLGTQERGALTQASIRPYVNLVEMVQNALEKVREQQERQRRLADLQALNEISEAIAVETDLENFYSLIGQQILKAVGDVGLYIALYDAESDHIEIPYGYENGAVVQVDPFPLGEGLSSIVIRTRQPLMLVEDTEERALALGAKIVGQSAKSWLGVPLTVGGEVIGMMSVQDAERERRFSEVDLRLFSTLATQIAGVIHNAQLLAESNEKSLQLKTAAEIAKETSGTLEMDELLRKAINLVRERFNFYHASVFLLDKNGEYAVVKESTGNAGRKMMDEGHKLEVGSKSVMGYVTATGEPLVINDVSQNPNHHFNPLLPETQSELGIPLKIRNTILGALDVQSTELFAFSQDDVEVLQILADQLAVAVANAELFTEAQEHLSQHRLIHDITTVAASSSSFDEALTSIVEGLRSTLGERVAILLLDTTKNDLYITASAGYGDDLVGMRIEVGRGITGWVAQHREALIVNDVQADPRYIPGNSSVRSELAVPILYRGELMGVLNIESDEMDAFDKQDEEILGTVAGSLAAIMVNTRLSERQQQLFEVTNKIRRSVNMGTILETTANELSRVLNTRRARIEVGVGKLADSTEQGNGSSIEPENGMGLPKDSEENTA